MTATYGFRAYAPAGSDTYVSATRRMAYAELRRLLRAHRSRLPRPVLWHTCGSVDRRISTLYDAGHPDAYHLLQRFEFVKRLCRLTDPYCDQPYPPEDTEEP